MKATANVGFDLGGQTIKAVLVSPSGVLLDQASLPSGGDTDLRQLVDMVATLVGGLESSAGETPDSSAALGLGVPGVLDSAGRLLGSPNLPALQGVVLAERLAAALARPVLVENDANCAALAEGLGGAADGAPDYLLVTLGTGLGSGLVLDGKLYRGPSGRGCELGHAVIVQGGRRCGCSARGCLEAYVSETATVAMVEELDTAQRSRLLTRAEQEGRGLAHSLFENAEGDEVAARLGGHMIAALGAGLASAVNSMDLPLIVLGGGLAPVFMARVDDIRREIAAALFARGIDELRTVEAVHGRLAGAMGAARLAGLAGVGVD